MTALRAGTDARSTIRDLLMGRVAAATANNTRRGCPMVAAAIECLPADQRVARVVRDVTRAIEEALAEVLGDAMGRGNIRGGRDPHRLAEFVIAVMNGLLVATKITADREKLEGVVDIALEALT